MALTGVLILQAARYWAEGEEDDGSLESRVDSSEGNWKRSPRPALADSPSKIAGTENSNGRHGRTSLSPASRRRSPVKRKAANSNQ